MCVAVQTAVVSVRAVPGAVDVYNFDVLAHNSRKRSEGDDDEKASKGRTVLNVAERDGDVARMVSEGPEGALDVITDVSRTG